MSNSLGAADLIPIESNTKTIQACFQQCLYEVPNFQRPYSWTEDQLEDFWHDVVLAQGDFFFGSTVTWVSKKRELFNDTYSIIDGQQRLTTSAIILSVIRDAFHQLAEVSVPTPDVHLEAAMSQARATQKYLVAVDDDGYKYPVLSRPEEMFYETIQTPSAIPSGVSWNSSARRIGNARMFFEKRITDDIEGMNFDDQLERLKNIRSNVLRARVIQIELTSEEDGFLIFETLNTRGSELQLSDLVKNLLVRGGASDAEDRDTIASRWDRLIERVQKDRTGVDIANRFIWQSWNSRREAVKEPELFKAISRMVGASARKHLGFLEELETDSFTYQLLDDEHCQPEQKVSGQKNAFAVPEFVDAVRALAIFNVSVANSTVLAIVRKFDNTSLVGEGQLIDVVKMVEAFHFQFSALTSSGSTGGTRARYNRFAVRLEEAKTKQDVHDAISDLREKLTASLPSQDLVLRKFQELFYAPAVKLTQAQKPRARKIFIAYVLMSFAKHHKLLPAGQNLATWSIEHVKPQAMGDHKVRNPIYSIGNLALLTVALNGDLKDGSLADKADGLRTGTAYLDDELASWLLDKNDYPTEHQIKSRAKLLAQEALTSIWTLRA